MRRQVTFKEYDESAYYELVRQVKQCTKEQLVDFVTEKLSYSLGDDGEVYMPFMNINIKIEDKE